VFFLEIPQLDPLRENSGRSCATRRLRTNYSRTPPMYPNAWSRPLRQWARAYRPASRRGTIDPALVLRGSGSPGRRMGWPDPCSASGGKPIQQKPHRVAAGIAVFPQVGQTRRSGGEPRSSIVMRSLHDPSNAVVPSVLVSLLVVRSTEATAAREGSQDGRESIPASSSVTSFRATRTTFCRR
jgi:hypothetical protein